jgi:hypothetical protein
MRRGIRLVASIALLAGLLSAAALAAPARHTAAARVDCGVKGLTFLFWPQGHNAIPSIGFPSYPPPHMEVYKNASGTYPDQNEVAVIEFTSSGQTAGGFAKQCKTVRPKILNSRPLRAKTTTATALTCKFPATAQLNFTKQTAPIGISMTASLRSKTSRSPLEVQARMTAAGSTLRYDPKYCKAYPPPH